MICPKSGEGKIIIRWLDLEGKKMNEHMAVQPGDFTYEKFIWTLLTEAHNRKLTIEIIGQETSQYTGMIYPLYRMVINPEVKDTICIVAGIHGNEIAGPLAILRLLEAFFDKFPQDFRYIIYPVINPTGFDLRQRYDDDGRDLNAIYSETLNSANYQEVQAFYEDVAQFKPFKAVLTLHEDSDLEKFYMYGLGKDNLEYYHAMCAFAKIFCPGWTNADIYGSPSDEFGLILAKARDHAFDAALYSEGSTTLAFTLETPGKLDIAFRMNMMAQWVLHSLQLLDAKRYMTAFSGAPLAAC
jgi:predicted deacylase